MKLVSLTRDYVKKAVAKGRTSSDLIREFYDSGITDEEKLKEAIKAQYRSEHWYNQLLEKLADNDAAAKPVLAAPCEENVSDASDANEPVAESPATGTVKPASQVPENPASDPCYVSKYTKRALNIAAQNGCVIDSDYIVNFYDELIKLPLDTVYVPLFVLNSLRKLIEVGRLDQEILERIEFLEKNVHVMKEAPADIIIVDSSAKQRSVLFAKHVVNVRRTSCPNAIALTKSYEVRNLLSDYENANK